MHLNKSGKMRCIKQIYYLFFCAFLISTTALSQNKRPNIIFILTDDQRWDALGVAGNPIIQTPEMDALARTGTYFKNAFSTTPICAASRASILTGLYERTHGYTSMIGEGVQIVGDIFIKKSEEIPFTLPDIQVIRRRNSSGMPLPTSLFVSLYRLALRMGMITQRINIFRRINPLIFIKTQTFLNHCWEEMNISIVFQKKSGKGLTG